MSGYRRGAHCLWLPLLLAVAAPQWAVGKDPGQNGPEIVEVELDNASAGNALGRLTHVFRLDPEKPQRIETNVPDVKLTAFLSTVRLRRKAEDRKAGPLPVSLRVAGHVDETVEALTAGALADENVDLDTLLSRLRGERVAVAVRHTDRSDDEPQDDGDEKRKPNRHARQRIEWVEGVLLGFDDDTIAVRVAGANGQKHPREGPRIIPREQFVGVLFGDQLLRDFQQAGELTQRARVPDGQAFLVECSGKHPVSLRLSYQYPVPPWQMIKYQVTLPEESSQAAAVRAWVLIENSTPYDWKEGTNVTLKAGKNVYRRPLPAALPSHCSRVFPLDLPGVTVHRVKLFENLPERETGKTKKAKVRAKNAILVANDQPQGVDLMASRIEFRESGENGQVLHGVAMPDDLPHSTRPWTEPGKPQLRDHVEWFVYGEEDPNLVVNRMASDPEKVIEFVAIKQGKVGYRVQRPTTYSVLSSGSGEPAVKVLLWPGAQKDWEFVGNCASGAPYLRSDVPKKEALSLVEEAGRSVPIPDVTSDVLQRLLAISGLKKEQPEKAAFFESVLPICEEIEGSIREIGDLQKQLAAQEARYQQHARDAYSSKQRAILRQLTTEMQRTQRQIAAARDRLSRSKYLFDLARREHGF